MAIVELSETDIQKIVNDVFERVSASTTPLETLEVLEDENLIKACSSLPVLLHGMDDMGNPDLTSPATLRRIRILKWLDILETIETYAEGQLDILDKLHNDIQSILNDEDILSKIDSLVDASTALELATTAMLSSETLKNMGGETVRFSAYIEDEVTDFSEEEHQFNNSTEYDVVYLTTKKCFAAKTTDNKYYSRWTNQSLTKPYLEVSMYNKCFSSEGAYTGALEIWKDKTYICGSSIYVWDGSADGENNLVEISGTGGGGSGSGFLNLTVNTILTKKVSGFVGAQSLSEAISILYTNKDILGFKKNEEGLLGLGITYYDSTDSEWKDYKNIFTQVSQLTESAFKNVSNWVRNDLKGTVRSVQVGNITKTADTNQKISFSNSELSGVVIDNTIQSDEIDDVLGNNEKILGTEGKMPLSISAYKKNLEEKFGEGFSVTDIPNTIVVTGSSDEGTTIQLGRKEGDDSPTPIGDEITIKGGGGGGGESSQILRAYIGVEVDGEVKQTNVVLNSSQKIRFKMWFGGSTDGTINSFQLMQGKSGSTVLQTFNNVSTCDENNPVTTDEVEINGSVSYRCKINYTNEEGKETSTTAVISIVLASLYLNLNNNLDELCITSNSIRLNCLAVASTNQLNTRLVYLVTTNNKLSAEDEKTPIAITNNVIYNQTIQLEQGLNHIFVYAIGTIGSSSIYSNGYFFDVYCTGSSNTYTSTRLSLSMLKYSDAQNFFTADNYTPTFRVKQFDSTSGFNFSMYKQGSNQQDVTVDIINSANDIEDTQTVSVNTLNTSDTTVHKYHTYTNFFKTTNESDSKTIRLSSNNSTYELKLLVVKGTFGVDLPDGGNTIFDLRASGKSNNNTSRNSWTYGQNIKTTFSNFKWNDISGWNEDALLFSANNYIDINYFEDGQQKAMPYSNFKNFTFNIKYRTANTSNDNFVFFKMISNEKEILSITPTCISINQGEKEVHTSMDSFVDLTITRSHTTKSFAAVFVNGIFCGLTNSDETLWLSENISNIHIGASTDNVMGCKLYLYNITCYKDMIADNSAIGIYALNAKSSDETFRGQTLSREALVESNKLFTLDNQNWSGDTASWDSIRNLYGDYQGDTYVSDPIEPFLFTEEEMENIPDGLRVMIVEGPDITIDGNTARMDGAVPTEPIQNDMIDRLNSFNTDNKSTRLVASRIITYIKGKDESNKSKYNYWLERPTVCCQGTSSMGYPIKNLRIYTQKRAKLGYQYDPSQMTTDKKNYLPMSEAGELAYNTTTASALYYYLAPNASKDIIAGIHTIEGATNYVDRGLYKFTFEYRVKGAKKNALSGNTVYTSCVKYTPSDEVQGFDKDWSKKLLYKFDSYGNAQKVSSISSAVDINGASYLDSEGNPYWLETSTNNKQILGGWYLWTRSSTSAAWDVKNSTLFCSEAEQEGKVFTYFTSKEISAAVKGDAAYGKTVDDVKEKTDSTSSNYLVKIYTNNELPEDFECIDGISRYNSIFGLETEDVQANAANPYSFVKPLKVYPYGKIAGDIMNKNGRGDAPDKKAKGSVQLNDGMKPSSVLTVKLDFADSTSAQNTGGANFTNEVLKYMRMTPPQRAQSTVNVRTSVYGQPGILFSYSASGWGTDKNKKYRFRGKINVNTDKSDANIYGFTGCDEYNKSFNGMGMSEFATKRLSQIYGLNINSTNAEEKQRATQIMSLIDKGFVQCWEFATSSLNATIRINPEYNIGSLLNYSTMVNVNYQGQDTYGNITYDYPIVKKAYNINNLNIFSNPKIYQTAHCLGEFYSLDKTLNNNGESWKFDFNSLIKGQVEGEASTVEGIERPLWSMAWELRYPDAHFELNDWVSSVTKQGGDNAQLDVTNKDDEVECMQINPVYIETIYNWVSSFSDIMKDYGNGDWSLTDDQATIDTLKQRFVNEVLDYFDVRNLCAYYALTELLFACDQRVKNQMLAIFYENKDTYDYDIANYKDSSKTTSKYGCMDGRRGYFIFYDCDTTFGLNNGGSLEYGWDADWDTKVTGYGYTSVLWNMVRVALINTATMKDGVEIPKSWTFKAGNNQTETFKCDVRNCYDYIRGYISDYDVYSQKTPFTNYEINCQKSGIDNIIKYYNEELSYKFTEQLFSKDAFLKYYKYPRYYSNSVGSNTEHKRWWIDNRLKYLDAIYSTGVVNSMAFKFKLQTNQNANIKISALTSRGTSDMVVNSTGAKLGSFTFNSTTKETWNVPSTMFGIYNESNISGWYWMKEIEIEANTNCYSGSFDNIGSLGSSAEPLRYLTSLKINRLDNLFRYITDKDTLMGSSNFVCYNYCPAIETLKLYNEPNRINLDLSNNQNILHLDCFKSYIQQVIFPIGCLIDNSTENNMVFTQKPSSVGNENRMSIVMKDMPNITIEDLKFYNGNISIDDNSMNPSVIRVGENWNTLIGNVQMLYIDNCEKISSLNEDKTVKVAGENLIIKLQEMGISPTSTQKFYVSINNISMSGDFKELDKFLTPDGTKVLVGGVVYNNGSYNTEEGSGLHGDFYLDVYPSDEDLSKYQSLFPHLEFHAPDYSYLVIDNFVDSNNNEITEETTTAVPLDSTAMRASNPANKTGFRYGNFYEPCGHFEWLLNRRKKVLAKNVIDEVTQTASLAIAPITVKNGTIVYEQDQSKTASLTGGDGDVFIVEPQYWYKGVNDWSTGKQYIMISSLDSNNAPKLLDSSDKPSMTSIRYNKAYKEYQSSWSELSQGYIDSTKCSSKTSQTTNLSQLISSSVTINKISFNVTDSKVFAINLTQLFTNDDLSKCTYIKLPSYIQRNYSVVFGKVDTNTKFDVTKTNFKVLGVVDNVFSKISNAQWEQYIVSDENISGDKIYEKIPQSTICTDNVVIAKLPDYTEYQGGVLYAFVTLNTASDFYSNADQAKAMGVYENGKNGKTVDKYSSNSGDTRNEVFNDIAMVLSDITVFKPQSETFPWADACDWIQHKVELGAVYHSETGDPNGDFKAYSLNDSDTKRSTGLTSNSNAGIDRINTVVQSFNNINNMFKAKNNLWKHVDIPNPGYQLFDYSLQKNLWLMKMINFGSFNDRYIFGYQNGWFGEETVGQWSDNFKNDKASLYTSTKHIEDTFVYTKSYVTGGFEQEIDVDNDSINFINQGQLDLLGMESTKSYAYIKDLKDGDILQDYEMLSGLYWYKRFRKGMTETHSTNKVYDYDACNDTHFYSYDSCMGYQYMLTPQPTLWEPNSKSWGSIVSLYDKQSETYRLVNVAKSVSQHGFTLTARSKEQQASIGGAVKKSFWLAGVPFLYVLGEYCDIFGGWYRTYCNTLQQLATSMEGQGTYCRQLVSNKNGTADNPMYLCYDLCTEQEGSANLYTILSQLKWYHEIYTDSYHNIGYSANIMANSVGLGSMKTYQQFTKENQYANIRIAYKGAMKEFDAVEFRQLPWEYQKS